MNCTNPNNGIANSATAANPIKLPYRATLHPTHRALWNIPHVIQIPDPMPAPADVVQLLREHLSRHEAQLSALTPTDDDQIALMANHKFDISILKHKIEEVLRAFPDLAADPEGRAPLSQRAASVPATPDNQPTSSAPIAPTPTPPSPHNNNSSPENSGQNPQPPLTPPDPEWPKTGQDRPDTGQDRPNAGQHRPDPCHSRPDNGQPSQDDDAANNDDDDDDPQQDESQEEEDDDDLDLEEADLEAEIAGYFNDAERMAEAAADLRAHRQKRSRFDSLSAEDQATIIHMLGIHDSRTVVRTIAKPSPEGFNFKISKSALNEWARRYEKRQVQLRIQQAVQAATDLIDKSGDPDKATSLGTPSPDQGPCHNQRPQRAARLHRRAHHHHQQTPQTIPGRTQTTPRGAQSK